VPEVQTDIHNDFARNILAARAQSCQAFPQPPTLLMKQLTLLKQRIVGHAQEPPEFLDNKKQVLAIRDQILKVSKGLKAWQEGAEAMEKAAQSMNTSLEAADPGLVLISTTVSREIAMAKSATEMAMHSMNQKAASLSELKTKCATLGGYRRPPAATAPRALTRPHTRRYAAP
jgi:hypothetical protein